MLRIVRSFSVVVIVALCVGIFAFAKVQQQIRPAGQGGPAAEAAKDTCWGRTPCPEDHRPLVAFREDWMDATPGVPTDYKDKDLDAHLQNKNLQHGGTDWAPKTSYTIATLARAMIRATSGSAPARRVHAQSL